MSAFTDLIQLLEPYQYVSFDIYDTLIFRTVLNYEEVFDGISECFKRSHGVRLHNFRQQRIIADNKARFKNGCSEVTLSQIYACLPYRDELKEILKEEEIKYEIGHTMGNELMINVLTECRNKGKRIIITSDMYLPQEVIEQILRDNSIPYDYLFVSSHYGVTKRSGKLFDVILNELDLSPHQVVHIGDDKICDMEMPVSKGFTAIERIYNRSSIDDYYLKNYRKKIHKTYYDFLHNRIKADSNTNVERRIGYYALGMFALASCEWIHQIKLEKNIEKLFFVAREGYLLKQCYDIVYPDECTEYIRLNKNLLRLPSIRSESDIASFINSIPALKSYSWEQLLDYFYIKEKDAFIKDAQNRGFHFEIKETLSGDKLRRGCYNKEIQYIIHEEWDKIEMQKEFLKSYLVQNGILSGKIGLVNNSANGNGQMMLINYLSSENLDSSGIIGLQLIKSIKCKSVLGERALSMISFNYKNMVLTNLLHRNSLVLEHLFFEPSGTALHFMKGEKGIEPFCDTRRKEELNDPFIVEVQKNAIQFIRDCKKYGLPSLGMDGILPFIGFLSNPQKVDAIKICNIYNDDVEGDRKLVDTDLSLEEKYLNHDYVCWIEGFLKIKDAKDKFRPYMIKRNKDVKRMYMKYKAVSSIKKLGIFPYIIKARHK